MTVLEVADKLFEEARRGSRRCALCGGFGGGDRRGNVRRIGIAARFGGGYKGKDLGFGGIPGSGVPGVVAGLGQDAAMLVVGMGGTVAHGTSHRRIEGAVVAGGIVGTDASHYLQAVARDAAEGSHHPRQGADAAYDFVRTSVGMVQVDAQQSAVACQVAHGVSAPAGACRHHTGGAPLQRLRFGLAVRLRGQSAVVQCVRLEVVAAYAPDEAGKGNVAGLFAPDVRKFGNQERFVFCS